MSTTFEYLLPDLGEGIAEAEVISWAVEIDETVAAHQTLLVVETDKAQVELPCPVDGVLTERGAAEGAMVKVGSAIARFATEGKPSASDQVPASTSNHRALAAPTVRKLATEMGIDLATVTGTGPGGRVVKDDVLHAAEPQAARASGGSAGLSDLSDPAGVPVFSESVGDVDTIALRGMRRTIARKMTIVAQTVPMVSGHQEVDVTELVSLIEELRPMAQKRGVRLTWTALFALATTHALREYPTINSLLDMDKEELSVHRRINLGMAASVDGGLVVPVIKDAARLSLLELAGEIDRISEAARARTLSKSELSGSTFTLTNYGSVGGWFGTMMVNAPEVGIVGFGRLEQKPLVVNGEIAIRTVVPLSSTFDHRVVDGALGAQFTGAIKARLEEPQLLLLGGRHGDG